MMCSEDGHRFQVNSGDNWEGLCGIQRERESPLSLLITFVFIPILKLQMIIHVICNC